MFSTPMMRLMWKEYRVQRALWLVQLAVGVVWMVSWAAFGWVLLSSSGMIFTLAMCFAAASGSLLFAGEVDERTAGLLRMLPVKTRSLLLAKILSSLLGSLGLVAALYLTDWVVAEATTRLSPYPPRTFERGTGGPGVALLAVLFAASVFALTALAAMSSMLTRKVLSSLALTGVLGLVGAVTASLLATVVLISGKDDFHVIVAITMVLMAVILMTTVFVRRWHLGSLPKSWWPRRLDASTFVMPRTTRWRISMAGIWQRALERIVARPMSASRVTCVLCCRELRPALSTAGVCLAIGLMLSGARLLMQLEYFPLPAVFIVATIMVSGNRSISNDRAGSALHMLAAMGVSPLRVWFAKTVVWLPIAVLTAVILLVADTTSMSDSPPGGRNVGRLSNSIGLMSLIHVPLPFGLLPENLSDLSKWHLMNLRLQIAAAASMMFGVFAIGQLSGAWIRRAVLSMSSAFFGCIALGGIIAFCVVRDWSLCWTTLPLAATWLLAAAMTSRSWLDDSHQRRYRVSQAAWIVLPICLLSAVGYGTWLMRATVAASEANLVLPNAQRGYLHNERLLSDTVPAPELSKSESDEWMAYDQKLNFYKRALEVRTFRLPYVESDFAKGIELHERLSTWRTTRPQATITAELLGTIESVLSRRSTPIRIPTLWQMPESRSPAPMLVHLLLADAFHHEAAGNIALAQQRILTAIRVSRDLSEQAASWMQWLLCVDAEGTALAHLRCFIAGGQLNEDQLTDLESELAVILKKPLHPGQMLLNRELAWGLPLSRPNDNDLRDHQQRFVGTSYAVPRERPMSSWSPLGFIVTQNRLRALRTMIISRSLIAGLPFDHPHLMPDVLARSFRDSGHSALCDDALRLSATSSLGDIDVDSDILRSQMHSSVMQPIIDTLAAERLTRVVIRLHRHRLAHGQFPDNLIEIAHNETDVAFVLSDPMNGAAFTFHRSPSTIEPDATSIPEYATIGTTSHSASWPTTATQLFQIHREHVLPKVLPANFVEIKGLTYGADSEFFQDREKGYRPLPRHMR